MSSQEISLMSSVLAWNGCFRAVHAGFEPGSSQPPHELLKARQIKTGQEQVKSKQTQSRTNVVTWTAHRLALSTLGDLDIYVYFITYMQHAWHLDIYWKEKKRFSCDLQCNAWTSEGGGVTSKPKRCRSSTNKLWGACGNRDDVEWKYVESSFESSYIFILSDHLKFCRRTLLQGQGGSWQFTWANGFTQPGLNQLCSGFCAIELHVAKFPQGQVDLTLKHLAWCGDQNISKPSAEDCTNTSQGRWFKAVRLLKMSFSWGVEGSKMVLLGKL